MDNIFQSNLNSILESMQDGIWVTDGEGYVLYLNSAYEKVSGIKRDEVIGKHMQELLNDKFFSDSATLSVLKNKKQHSIIGRLFRSDKEILSTATPVFDESGNILYVVTNVRDITELIKLNQELQKKQRIIDEQDFELEILRFLHKEIDESFIVKSPHLQKAFELAVRAGRVDSTVLLLGESGVGKELIANTIYKSGLRSKDPFIKFNCSAIPENLIESELFGYEKGAFTGADSKGKKGILELAQNGTIFLDEIGELPLSIQPKLLRAIEEKKIIRLGSTVEKQLDIKIITATNRNLDEMVTAGLFREDLFYRLSVITINIPALRERVEDILPLIAYFLSYYNQKFKMQKTISPEVLDELLRYSWPGNVRELKNLIESLLVLTEENIITINNLPKKYLQQRKPDENSKGSDEVAMSFKTAIDNLERKLLIDALNKYRTTYKAAEALGMNQSTIVRKMQKYDLEKVIRD